MSYFKKFTDLVGGVGLFFALVYLVGKYMAFSPDEEVMLEEGASKLDLFLRPEGIKEHRQYIVLIVLLFAAVVLGRILKKLPAIALAVSLFPLVQVLNMHHMGLLYENRGFYIFISVTLICGNFYEAIYRDRADCGKRTFLAAGLAGAISSALCAITLLISTKYSYISDLFFEGELTEELIEFNKKLETVGIDMMKVMPEGEIEAVKLILIMVLVSLIVSFILRGVYFIDLVLAAVPLVYSVMAWHGDKLATAPMLVLVPVWIYFFCRVALFITGAGVKVEKK